MNGTEVNLSDQERSALRRLARLRGKTEGELIRQAVGRLLSESQDLDRLSLIKGARCMWSDRDDLPEFRDVRREWDRVPA
jgi:hypothetical protein